MALHAPSSFPSQTLLSWEGSQHHSQHLLQGKACPKPLVSSWRAAGAWGRIRLGSFPLSSNITLTSFSKMSISSHCQQPQPRDHAPFPCVQRAPWPVPARISIPSALVVGHMSWVILARPVSLWNTSAGSAAPWLPFPSHLLLPDAPGRGCTHREGAGFPQPPLSPSAHPWEGPPVKSSHAAEALSGPCRAVFQHFTGFGGSHWLFPLRE